MSAEERTVPSARGTRRIERGERAIGLAPRLGPFRSGAAFSGAVGSDTVDAVALLPPEYRISP